MSGGKLFHSRALAIAKVRSPTVAHCDWWTLAQKLFSNCIVLFNCEWTNWLHKTVYETFLKTALLDNAFTYYGHDRLLSSLHHSMRMLLSLLRYVVVLCLGKASSDTVHQVGIVDF